MWIKSEHCIGLLKARFRCLQGLWQVIQSKRDLDAILQMTMCAYILQNFLINHAIPQDWMVNNMELEEVEEPEHHNNERSNQHDQILAYMQEIH